MELKSEAQLIKVEALASLGADLDARDSNGWTAAHAAAAAGQVPVFALGHMPGV